MCHFIYSVLLSSIVIIRWVPIIKCCTLIPILSRCSYSRIYQHNNYVFAIVHGFHSHEPYTHHPQHIYTFLILENMIIQLLSIPTSFCYLTWSINTQNISRSPGAAQKEYLIFVAFLPWPTIS